MLLVLHVVRASPCGVGHGELADGEDGAGGPVVIDVPRARHDLGDEGVVAVEGLATVPLAEQNSFAVEVNAGLIAGFPMTELRQHVRRLFEWNLLPGGPTGTRLGAGFGGNHRKPL